LVPILGRKYRLLGLVVLGPRFSEEPYSAEDKRLLDSVAGQAAVALENLHMAEQIAERLEVDRRNAHEMQIARDVQSRLFPQVMPPCTRSNTRAAACKRGRSAATTMIFSIWVRRSGWSAAQPARSTRPPGIWPSCWRTFPGKESPVRY
jgi:hypothetical protein